MSFRHFETKLTSFVKKRYFYVCTFNLTHLSLRSEMNVKNKQQSDILDFFLNAMTCGLFDAIGIFIQRFV